MPPPDWNTKAGFDSVYYGTPEYDGHPWTRQRVMLNYHRWKVYPEAQQYADFYTTITDPTNSIVIVGSGFAWSLEILVDQYGYDPALLTGVDTSTWVQGAKDTTEEQEIRDAITAVGLDPDTGRGLELLTRCYFDTRPRATITVLNETLQNQGSRNRVLNAVGGSADFVISELMMSGLSDAEAVLVDQQMTDLDIGQTWHVVMDQFTYTNEAKSWTRIRQPDIDKWDWNTKTLEGWAALMPNSNFVSAFDFRAIGPDVV